MRRGDGLVLTADLDPSCGNSVSSRPRLGAISKCETNTSSAEPFGLSYKEPSMKWLAFMLALGTLAGATGCWRPYYGRNYAPPAVAQPAFGQPTYQQPIAQAQPVQTQPAVYAQPQVIQAAPAVQCQPCQPNPCCVPCY